MTLIETQRRLAGLRRKYATQIDGALGVAGVGAWLLMVAWMIHSEWRNFDFGCTDTVMAYNAEHKLERAPVHFACHINWRKAP